MSNGTAPRTLRFAAANGTSWSCRAISFEGRFLALRRWHANLAQRGSSRSDASSRRGAPVFAGALYWLRCIKERPAIFRHYYQASGGFEGCMTELMEAPRTRRAVRDFTEEPAASPTRRRDR